MNCPFRGWGILPVCFQKHGFGLYVLVGEISDVLNSEENGDIIYKNKINAHLIDAVETSDAAMDKEIFLWLKMVNS